MKASIRQTVAIARSECLRMATSPAWSILLFLWTLVCGLFFQIVINYAAANALPVGETPMSYFFRTAPFLLPLLLIVFVPQLTMDVVAGRRERGRMEHLLISGMHPGALIAGAFIAICGLLLLLLIPPLLFHGIVAMHADPDFGKTCSALCSLLFIGASIAALGLSVSCWAPNRLAASLIAVSIGMAWWIIDVFGQQIDQSDNWESWRASLAMALTIYDSASGLLEPRLLVGFTCITISLLYIARCGLDWQRFPRARVCSAILALIIGFILISHVQSWRSRWDMTSYQTHSIHPETRALCEAVIKNGGLHVTLASTPSMRSDPIDGPIYERCRHLFQRLENSGLVFDEMDPALDPNGSMQLTKEFALNSKDWQHPLLIVRHLDKFAVVRGHQLGIYQQTNKTMTLKAIRCEGAFLSALQYLKDGRHLHIAWLQNPSLRPINSDMLHQRNSSMQSAVQRFKSDGFRVEVVKDIEKTSEADLFVIAGPKKDFSPSELVHLHTLLRNGCSIFLLIDGNNDTPQLDTLRSFIADYGIHQLSGQIISTDKIEASNAQSPIGEFTSYAKNGDEPFTLLFNEQRSFFLTATAALSVKSSSDKNYTSKGFFNFDKDFGIQLQQQNQQTSTGLDKSFCPLAIAESKLADKGHLCVAASVDSFSDAHIHKHSNALILSLLGRHLSKKQSLDILPPESVQAHRFTLSTAQKLLLIWCVGIGLPIISALLGGFIAWRRRCIQ